MKFLCGIITYNPNLTRLCDNIKSIINQVDKLIIIDNDSTNKNQIMELTKIFKKLVIISNKVNEGIAFALNQVMIYAQKENYDWALTLDQDTISPPNMIDIYSKYCEERIGVLSPSIIYNHNEKYITVSQKAYDVIDWAITSGSLINLQAWNDIGGFDNQLFIDFVDYDFCIRVKNKGYTNLRINNVQINHELGNLKCHKFFNKVIYVTNHSYLRQYYMTRNVLYLNKKITFNHPYHFIFKQIFKIIFFEKEKFKKLRYIRKGIKDSKKMNRV